MKVNIRNAKPEDWKDIQRLNIEVYKASEPYDPWFKMNHPYSESEVDNYKLICHDYNGCVLIAEIEGRPVGYLVGEELEVDYRDARFGEIHHMGVTEKMRSKGIGKLLIDEFKLWCQKKELLTYMQILIMKVRK